MAFSPRRARLAVAVLVGALLGLVPAASAAANVPPAMSIEVAGTVDPASAGWVERAPENAAADGAPLVILRLHTPGGLSASMRDIVQAILAAPPVVAHVTAGGVGPACPVRRAPGAARMRCLTMSGHRRLRGKVPDMAILVAHAGHWLEALLFAPATTVLLAAVVRRRRPADPEGE